MVKLRGSQQNFERINKKIKITVATDLRIGLSVCLLSVVAMINNLYETVHFVYSKDILGKILLHLSFDLFEYWKGQFSPVEKKDKR